MPYPDPNHIKSPLARARGTGSAHSGVHHWWLVKATALVLIPLTLWFFCAVVCMIAQGTADYATVLAWVQKPYNAFLLSIFLGMNFYHAALGGQEIIVDYVPNHKIQIPVAFLYRTICYGFGILSVFSVLYITFKL